MRGNDHQQDEMFSYGSLEAGSAPTIRCGGFAIWPTVY